MRRMLRRRAVEQVTGLSRSGLYQAIARGKFPRQIHLTDTAVGWDADEVEVWLDARRAERDAKLADGRKLGENSATLQAQAEAERRAAGQARAAAPQGMSRREARSSSGAHRNRPQK